MAHPIQDMHLDDQGTVRFRENAIVKFLLEEGPFDMNQIVPREDFSLEDLEQFAMLIGYSLGGFADLSYVRESTYDRAEAEARRQGLIQESEQTA